MSLVADGNPLYAAAVDSLVEVDIGSKHDYFVLEILCIFLIDDV